MPRAKRAKFTEASAAEQSPEPPKCASCGHELTWRDRFYVSAPKPREADEGAGAQPAPAGPLLCKTCHQRGRRKRLGVVAFHPATAQVKKGEKIVEVPVRFNREARRRPVAAQVSVPRERKPTRAERRAKARAATAVA